MKYCLKLLNLTLILLVLCAPFAGAVTNGVVNGAYEPNNKTDGVAFSLEIDPSSIEILEESYIYLYAYCVGYQGDEKVYSELLNSDECSWEIPSSGSGIASVDGYGILTALSEGTTSVTCSYYHPTLKAFVEGTAPVTVNPLYPDHKKPLLFVDPAGNELVKGDQVQLKAYHGTEDTVTGVVTKGEEADPTTLTWTSGDESVVTVDEKGLVTAVGVGSSFVTASYVDANNKIVSDASMFLVNPATVQHIEMESNLVMDLGSTYQLNPIIVTEEVNTLRNGVTTSFTFSSTGHNTVDVDENGLLTAKKIGKATITCKSGDLEAKCDVEVVYPDYVINAPTEINVEVGQKVKLGSTIEPNVGSITYGSANSKIATVSKYGNVKGIKVGQTVVYSIAPNGNRAVTVVNVVYPEYTIDVDTSSISLYGGKSYQINATLTPNVGKLRWSSSDKKVATVDQNGLVKARRLVNGEATITITAPDGKTKKTILVQVSKAPYELEIEEEMYMVGGEKRRIQKTLTPKNGRCTWTSSNTSVATVNMYGTVTAKRGVNGDCVITCTAPDGKTKDTCVVHVTGYKSHLYK